MCVAPPQRDFALQEILPIIYSGLGREIPTYEGLNSTLFDRIYATMEECRTYTLLPRQQGALWTPILTEIQQMMGLDVSSPPPAPQPAPAIDVEDGEMEF